MLAKIKEAVQHKLYQKCIEEYNNELSSQTDAYLLWIKEKESVAQKKEGARDMDIIYIENCGSSFTLSDKNKEIAVFVSSEGVLSKRAYSRIKEYFDKNPDINIAYADEDTWFLNTTKDDLDTNNELTHRIFPWSKPVWSPDTLFSYMYFGNVFAVRTRCFKDLMWLGNNDYKKNIYDFVLKATEQEGKSGHIDEILFHKYKRGTDKKTVENALMCETDFIGVGREYDFIREQACERRGIKVQMLEDNRTGITYPLYGVKDAALVSIVIPSKDNYEVLRQCISSVCKNTNYANFEIIVVDNGSSQDNKNKIEVLRQEYAFEYIYEPMDFNFSRMCNRGVAAANGDYILLLNDDMEAIDSSWLSRLLGQASLSHVGAVGAKLLYPESVLIQHVGITNTMYGPGHKLKQMEDSQSYYFGRNRFVYDMIGVTAACLLMKRSVYDSIGGLYEGLAVAYNDVDLCFRLHEMGLYNVIRNDVVLHHHESLSRGDDMQDKAKFKRLMTEKDVLYDRHPKLYKHDPFISTLMNDGEPEYSCRWLEGYELVNVMDHDVPLTKRKPLPDIQYMNQAIMVVTEDCGKEKNTEKPYYLIKGWAYIPGVDNARYRFKLLFCNSKGEVWELPLQKRYRKDVAAILLDEKNVELTGFCNWVYDGVLSPDTYELWLTAKDGCSRQVLYRNMEKSLVVE